MAPSTRTPLFVHVQVTDFLVEAERFRRPALAARALVIGGAADGPGRVVAASRDARARGVTVGQPLRAAARLCPEAAFLPGSIERQHDLRALVDEAIRHRVPRVAWTSIDEALLEMTAGAAAEARRAAEALQADVLRELGIPLAMGMAATPLAARAAARMALPRGLVVVLPGYDDRFLAALPAEELDGIDARAAARLDAAGIRTVGDVAGLDADAAQRLLGPGGAAIARLARGQSAPRPTWTPLPRRLCRFASFEDAEAADAALEALADAVSRALRRLRCVAGALSVRVETGGVSHSRGVLVADPTADAARVCGEARRLIGRATVAAGPGLMSLAASGLVATTQQPDLFGGTRRRTPSRAAHAGARRPAGGRLLAG